MSILEAVILGLIQGLTEFLPISSSGHLVLFQKLLGVDEAVLTFDVLLHLGTLVAVIGVFRYYIYYQEALAKNYSADICGYNSNGNNGLSLKGLF